MTFSHGTIIALMIFLATTAHGGTSEEYLILTPSRQLELAHTLVKEEAYSSAAHEYLRFSHLFPRHEKRETASYLAGDCFFMAGMYSDAQRELKKLTHPYTDTNVAPRATFKLAQVHVAAKDPGTAVVLLNNLITLAQEPTIQDRARFILAWLLIDHAASLEATNPHAIESLAQARKHIRQMSQQGRHTFGVDPALDQRLADISAKKQKNPTTAGMAALIPGGGFLYTERYRDALVSFLLNTSLILASHQAFEQDQNFLGGILAFVEAGFYTGNIYGSVSSAHKYNQNKKRQQIEHLKSDYARHKLQIQPIIKETEAGLFFSLPL